MAAQSTLRIVLQFLKQGGGDKETISSLEKMWKGAAQAAGIFGGLSAATFAVAKAIQQTVGTFVTYADQVRTVQNITGATAEESSRLIQVADDTKVSYESLSKAMQIASKQGITPNIEGLAALSDEYLRLSAGTQRESFLLKEFGKNGTEMAEMMSKGGAAIRQMAASMQPSLVLTQKNVDAARQYQRELDTLGDNANALKIQIGSGLVPVLNQLLGRINAGPPAMELATAAGQRWNELTFAQREVFLQEAEAIAKSNSEITQYADASDRAAARADALTRSQQDSASAALAQADATESVVSELEKLRAEIAGATGSSKNYFDFWVQQGIPANEAARLAISNQAESMRYAGLASLEMGRSVAKASTSIVDGMGDAAKSMTEPIGTSTTLNSKIKSLQNLAGQSWTYTFNLVTNGSLPNLRIGATGSNGLRVLATPMSSGGRLAGVALVGDNPDGTPNATSELVINGTVIPAWMTQILLKSGAVNPTSMAYGGALVDGQYGYRYGYRSSRRTQLGSIIGNIRRGGGVAGARAAVADGTGVGMGTGELSSSVTPLDIAPIAQGAQAAAQSAQAVSQAVSIQTAQSITQTRAITDGNQNVVEAINSLRQEFPRAVQAAVKLVVGG